MKSKASFLGSPAAKVGAASRNLLVLCGQLYNADCKDKGNTLNPYLPEKKSVVVLKMPVFEHAWAPGLVYPRVNKSC